MADDDKVSYMFGEPIELGDGDLGPPPLDAPLPESLETGVVPPPAPVSSVTVPPEPTHASTMNGLDKPPPGWKRIGRGVYLQTLLQFRLWTDDQLVAAVHAFYQNSRTGPADIKFNASLIGRRVGAKPSTLRRNVEIREMLPPPPWDPMIAKFAEQVISEDELKEALAYLNESEMAAGGLGNGATAWPMAPVFEVTPPVVTPKYADEKQPSRFRNSVDPDREFDKTSLREASHGQWIHRDYFAHAMRWSHAGRYISGNTDVLDVGCGPDVQLINVLTMPRNQVPRSYVGIDLNREPKRHPNRQWATLHWEFNFLERWQELGQFDVVTCYEMIEHLHQPDGLRLLEGLKGCLREDGILLLSTPNFSGKAAATHLHEYTIDELAQAIATAGLVVKRRFGTFANATTLRKVASAADIEFLDKLRPYYSDEILACIAAPLYPDVARNNLWLCSLT